MRVSVCMCAHFCIHMNIHHTQDSSFLSEELTAEVASTVDLYDSLCQVIDSANEP